MSARYNRAFDRLCEIEGYRSDDKNDPGGRTVWGIAKTFFPEMYSGGTEPSREQAKAFFKTRFWGPLRCEELDSAHVAFFLFQAGVNCGITTAVRFLQHAINRIALYGEPMLKEDGQFGPKTLALAQKYGRVYEGSLVASMMLAQGQYYESRGEAHRRSYIRGWLDRLHDSMQETAP